MNRSQLLASGVGSATIQSWVHTGRLSIVHRGVYALGYRRDDPPARAIAAVLACGPTALLSHESAAALWGWRRWPAVPEVTVTSDRRRRAIAVHRSATIKPADRDHQLGIPVTSPERTLRDIRRRLTAAQFRRIVSDARFSKRLGTDAVDRLLGYGPAPTRSELQDRFQRTVIDPSDLPQPLTDTIVNGFEVDAVWPDERVIVELDGWDAHGHRQAFIADRERDAVHAEHGFVVVRITSERLMDDPRREAERLTRIVTARAGRQPREWKR